MFIFTERKRMLYLLILLIAFDLFYFAGLLVLAFTRNFPEGGYAGTFVRVFTGMVACTVLYALFTTGFITVMLGALFVFMAVILIKRSERKGFTLLTIQMFRQEYKNAPFVFGAMVVLFAWQFFYLLLTPSRMSLIVGCDNLFAANLSSWLNHTGIESLDWNYVSPPHSTSPYHYFEAWLCAFLTGIFGGHSWHMMQLVVVPLLQLLAVCGTWSLVQKDRYKWLWMTAGFFILFVSPFYFDALQQYPLFLWSGSYGENAFAQPWMLKNLVVYVVMLMFLHYIQRKKATEAIGLLMLLPVFSITLAPSVLSTVFLFILADVILKGKITGSLLRPAHLLLPLLTGSYILYFYSAFGSTESPVPVLYDAKALISLFHFKTLLYKAAVALLLFSPWILLFGVANRLRGKGWIPEMTRSYSFRSALLFCGLLFVTSFYTWKVFEPVFGSYEFFYYAIVPVFMVLTFVTFIRSLLMVQSPAARVTLFVLLMSFSVFFAARALNETLRLRSDTDNLYSEAFREMLVKNANDLRQPGLKMENPAMLKEEFLNPNVNVCGTCLNDLCDPFSLVSVTGAQLLAEGGKPWSGQEKKMVAVNPLWKFMQDNNYGNDWKRATLSFMKENKTEYMILGSGVKADSLFLPYIRFSMTDRNSGETFILFKPVSP